MKYRTLTDTSAVTDTNRSLCEVGHGTFGGQEPINYLFGPIHFTCAVCDMVDTVEG